MIQRIQTVYFALAIILVTLPLLGITMFDVSHDQRLYHLTVFYSEDISGLPVKFPRTDYLLLLVLDVVLITTIFSFKNRKRQLTLGWFAFTLALLTSGWMLLGAYAQMISCTQCQNSHLSIGWIYYCFSTAWIFIFLGNRYVRKDKKLVDSLNRLR